MAALTKEKSTACNTKNVEYDINKVPLIISAIMNLSVTIMSLIGLVIHFQKSGLKMLILYTIDSNILGGIACFIAAVFTLRQIINNKPLPKRVSMLKYISTCCLCVTFFVVLFILAPTNGTDGFTEMFFRNDLLFHHLLCPLVSILSLLLFDKVPFKPITSALIALIPTAFYAEITIILNITHVAEGPYPFLLVCQQPIYISILWFFIIFSGAFVISLILSKIKQTK